MDPLTLALLLGTGTSLISGFLGHDASMKAANAQEAAALGSLALQTRMYEQGRADQMPWLTAGKSALERYQGELGMGAPGFQSGFRTSPGYQFAVQEGEKGVTGNLRALGLGGSGAALKALTRFRMGLADQEHGNYLNRLAALAGVGQTASTNLAASGAAYGANAGQAGIDAATARASGYTGSANSWMNALSGFSDNAGRWLGNYNQNWQRIAA